MTKTIHTIVDDIYDTLRNKELTRTNEITSRFAENLSKRLQAQAEERSDHGRLRLSGMGIKCPCALWYSLHHPELADAYKPWELNKFFYGHMLEEWIISLAKASGHEVVGEQDEIILDDVTGHRDCIIDGCVVDVKSATSRGLQKFKDRTIV